MRLFEDLSPAILILEAELDRDDLRDEERDALMDAWLESQGVVIDKLDHYAAWIKDVQDRAEGRRAQMKRMVEQIDRLRKLAEADEHRAARAQERMTRFFVRHKHEKLKTPRFNLTYQGVGGTRPLTIDTPAEELPEEFQITIPATIEPDKDKLRDALIEREKQLEMLSRVQRALDAAWNAKKLTWEEYATAIDLLLDLPIVHHELDGVRLAPKVFRVFIR